MNDALVSVEAPNGATTTYVYDDLGNLLETTSPDTGTTTYTYDAAGNRLTTVAILVASDSVNHSANARQAWLASAYTTARKPQGQPRARLHA